MLAEQFRESPQRVARMRELLQDPVFAAAIVCLQDERPSAVVALNADAIESVRVAAKLEQHETIIATLLSLAEPIPVEEVEPKATWGLSESEAAKLEEVNI